MTNVHPIAGLATMLHFASLFFTAGCHGSSADVGAPKYGSFSGRVRAEWNADGRTMTLLDDFGYVDPAGKRWDAPKGWTVDGASIPRAFWSAVGSPFTGPYRNASVIHDVACDRRTEPWQAVHRAFYDACRCGGLPVNKSKLLYFAVANFGPRWSMTPGASHAPMAPRPEVSEQYVLDIAAHINVYNPTLDELSTLADPGKPLSPEPYSTH